MTKNQKIALGCGGAGCLGLIVLVVVGLIAFYVMKRSPYSLNSNRSSNYNFNTNRSSNSNVSSSASNSNTNSNSSSTSSTSMSDDDKHKLYHAASITGDAYLVGRVSKKIGLLNEDNTPRDEYGSFLKDHLIWAFKNTDFIDSINTAEKAKAYVDAHIND